MSRSSLDSIIPARSFTNRPAPVTVRHPRVIRADDSRTIDPACLPLHHSSSSPPTPRTRRSSSSALRSPQQQHHQPPPAPPPSSPVSFPVPSYLNHSALRHLLRTDVSPTFVLAPRHYSPSSDSDEESSPPPTQEELAVVSPDQPLQLPTRWDAEACHNHLSISDNGRELTFQGTNSNGSDTNAAAARTVQSIPPACGIYYYEVKIIHSKSQKAYISIGFAGPQVRTSRLPGWEPNSWGYHGDDGCSFATEKKGTAFGPTFGMDDIIGCGIDFTTHRAFYTKNGEFLGHVFDNVGTLIPLYPSIGLQHTGDAIKVNFGHEPFKYDIDYHVSQQRDQTWEKMTSTTEALGGDVNTKMTLNKLVLSYLAHHGYVKTARTFQKHIEDVEMVGNDGDLDLDFEKDISIRTGIVDSVIRGDMDMALEETEKYYPKVFREDVDEEGQGQGLMLVKLRCRKFVEMVLEAAEMKRKMTMGVVEEDGMDVDVDDTKVAYESALQRAISYGQSLDIDYRKDPRPSVQSIFRKSFSVLAFYDPLEAGGSVGEVAGHEARMELAGELNRAILRSQGRPTRPTLETIYRHTSACIHYLGVGGVGAAAFADMQKELLEG